MKMLKLNNGVKVPLLGSGVPREELFITTRAMI